MQGCQIFRMVKIKALTKKHFSKCVKARAFLFAYTLTLHGPCSDGCASCLFKQDIGEDMWLAILDTCNQKVNTEFRIPATNQLQLCFIRSQNSVEQQLVRLESLKGL